MIIDFRMTPPLRMFVDPELAIREMPNSYLRGYVGRYEEVEFLTQVTVDHLIQGMDAGGVEKAVSYLCDHNITVLRDRFIKIGNAFYLAGREDKSVERFNGHARRALSEILTGIDPSLPLIVMDHQPMDVAEAVNAGADIQVSGHTHNGQLWPFNFITDAIFTVSSGYEKINTSHIYVSSGFGTWGPPVRTNSRSEIVNIRITFAE